MIGGSPAVSEFLDEPAFCRRGVYASGALDHGRKLRTSFSGFGRKSTPGYSKLLRAYHACALQVAQRVQVQYQYEIRTRKPDMV